MVGNGEVLCWTLLAPAICKDLQPVLTQAQPRNQADKRMLHQVGVEGGGNVPPIQFDCASRCGPVRPLR